jgi:uncharacterized protein (DUF58 family)
VDRHELLQKITTFPWIVSELADQLLTGDFRSIFKGQGIEAEEVRHYESGDDVRMIDWNVSARLGTPYVRIYREEREMTVFLVLDCSASMYCGGGLMSPFDQALLSASVLAFSAEKAGQSVGALFFDRAITAVFPPRKGKAPLMGMLRKALAITRGGQGSDLGAALAGAGRLLKRRSLVVLISDFLSVQWEQELGNLCRTHEVIALKIEDPLQQDLTEQGIMALEDPETGLTYQVPLSFPTFRLAWSAWRQERLSAWQGSCRSSGAAFMDISTAEDAPARLIQFFRGRGISRRRIGKP